MNGSPIRCMSCSELSVPAMVTLNFGGRLPATTFVRSFAPTTPRKRTFESARPWLPRW
jgi:hypothetical protein